MSSELLLPRHMRRGLKSRQRSLVFSASRFLSKHSIKVGSWKPAGREMGASRTCSLVSLCHLTLGQVTIVLVQVAAQGTVLLNLIQLLLPLDANHPLGKSVGL